MRSLIHLVPLLWPPPSKSHPTFWRICVWPQPELDRTLGSRSDRLSRFCKATSGLGGWWERWWPWCWLPLLEFPPPLEDEVPTPPLLPWPPHSLESPASTSPTPFWLSQALVIVEGVEEEVVGLPTLPPPLLLLLLEPSFPPGLLTPPTPLAAPHSPTNIWSPPHAPWDTPGFWPPLPVPHALAPVRSPRSSWLEKPHAFPPSADTELPPVPSSQDSVLEAPVLEFAGKGWALHNDELVEEEEEPEPSPPPVFPESISAPSTTPVFFGPATGSSAAPPHSPQDGSLSLDCIWWSWCWWGAWFTERGLLADKDELWREEEPPSVATAPAPSCTRAGQAEGLALGVKLAPRIPQLTPRELSELPGRGAALDMGGNEPAATAFPPMSSWEDEAQTLPDCIHSLGEPEDVGGEGLPEFTPFLPFPPPTTFACCWRCLSPHEALQFRIPLLFAPPVPAVSPTFDPSPAAILGHSSRSDRSTITFSLPWERGWLPELVPHMEFA